MKKKRIILISISAFILLIILALFMPVFLVSGKLMRPARNIPQYLPTDIGLMYSDVQFISQDGKTVLKGWIIPASTPTDKWLILSHGYTSNRNIWEDEKGQQFFRFIHDRNINTLTFDYRGCGTSDGDLVTVGYLEQNDLLAAVDHLKEKDPEARIGLIGWSQGSVVTLLSASRTDAVEFAIADLPFQNLETYLEKNLAFWSGLPHVPYTPMILKYMSIKAGIDYSQVSPRDSIGNIDIPILFIHCQGDEAVPCTNSEDMVEMWGDTKDIRLKLFPGSNHIRAYIDYPEQYQLLLTDFFSENGF